MLEEGQYVKDPPQWVESWTRVRHGHSQEHEYGHEQLQQGNKPEPRPTATTMTTGNILDFNGAVISMKKNILGLNFTRNLRIMIYVFSCRRGRLRLSGGMLRDQLRAFGALVQVDAAIGARRCGRQPADRECGQELVF
jgi:hypothetical protein